MKTKISTMRHVMISKKNYAHLSDCHKSSANAKALECGESVILFIDIKDIFKFVQQLVTLSFPFEYLV